MTFPISNAYLCLQLGSIDEGLKDILSLDNFLLQAHDPSATFKKYEICARPKKIQARTVPTVAHGRGKLGRARVRTFDTLGLQQKAVKSLKEPATCSRGKVIDEIPNLCDRDPRRAGPAGPAHRDGRYTQAGVETS